MDGPRIVTVTLNPAVDRVIEAPGFKVGDRVNGRLVAWFPTGRGITVSRALAHIGVRSIATGFVGQQELGMFEEMLERVGKGKVVVQFLVVRARSRDNITIVDPLNDTETHLRDVGFRVTEDDVRRIGSKLSMLAHEGTVMLFGGALPQGLEAGQFERMVGRCAKQGARVVIDTRGEALRALRGRDLWMLRIGAEALGDFADKPVDTEERLIEAARSLTRAAGGHIDYVLATRGAEGAILVGTEVGLIGRTSVHPGRIVSTVGSAEGLLAGLLGVWTKTGDWEEALREGLALATANAVGREAGLLDSEDVEEFRAMSMVERIGERQGAA